MLADHWHFTFNLQYIGNVDVFGARRQNFTTAKKLGRFCPDLSS